MWLVAAARKAAWRAGVGGLTLDDLEWLARPGHTLEAHHLFADLGSAQRRQEEKQEDRP